MSNPVRKIHTMSSSSDEEAGQTTPKPKRQKRIDLCIKDEKQNIFGFYLTKVRSLSLDENKSAVCLRDILSAKHGKLIASVQFSYVFDIEWLVQQYPEIFRELPLLIIHGEQSLEKRKLEQTGSPYPNIKMCQAALPIPYGTHHTKMMLLLYEEGLKIVIHTSNIRRGDWEQKTQGAWISPMFPKLLENQTPVDSSTNFKQDLIQYLRTYKIKELEEWVKHIEKHDLSTCRVFLIGSVPGRHIGSTKTMFGHLKLRKILTQNLSNLDYSNWPVLSQFSSIGSLGPSMDQWLTNEFLTSLAPKKNSLVSNLNLDILKLVFPTVENVRLSFEGYPAGANLPYSFKVEQKQTYLRKIFHQWRADCCGRSEASPHIKTYARPSPDYKSLAWFLITSANLSKAAWGSLEKNGNQLMIRSYELGVLFLPKLFDCGELFSLDENSNSFPFPYDLPPTKYSVSDEPWVWDTCHKTLPDRFGNVWCPS